LKHIIIRNARIINEGKDTRGDVLVVRDRIEKIGGSIGLPSYINFNEINADNLVLIPGMIDAHVHFREPGLTYKGSIQTESAAAVSGGITSFMDMPNTLPNVLTREILEDKYKIASRSSLCNYSFFMGLSKDNLEEALQTSTEDVCGLTDDGLYFHQEGSLLCNDLDYLEKLFARSSHLVALHSENDAIITSNLFRLKKQYGEFIPPSYHSFIRDQDACLTSTIKLLELAKKFNNRLHLLHISTGPESELFDQNSDVRSKRITSEACVHHLYFNTNDYEELGNLIKWNPSIKSLVDQQTLRHNLYTDKIDIIATDHAPHALNEKIGTYMDVKPGGPMVQHALLVLLEMYHQHKISLEKIVEKTSHNVADAYRIRERGYIREGYFADLVLLDLNEDVLVTTENIRYRCKWSPLIGNVLRGQVKKVMVNGHWAFDNDMVNDACLGMRMKFEKER
jgi:dihydroorotase